MFKLVKIYFTTVVYNICENIDLYTVVLLVLGVDKVRN